MRFFATWAIHLSITGALSGSFQNAFQIRRILGDCPAPGAEAALLVDGAHPFVEEFALGAVLLIVFAFDFENEHFSGGEFDEVIGPVGVGDALVGVVNGKAQMIVLYPGNHVFVSFEFKGFAGFPAAI